MAQTTVESQEFCFPLNQSSWRQNPLMILTSRDRSSTRERKRRILVIQYSGF
jgi:hypothetical protein